ncbi:urea transporter [Corynebacterium lowii]|uniref:Urea transporter n=1 Tax=Corynebacterium lowii TaxID=1544413 RepID=A0A0Q0ZBD3_9CORY|nr:urea transporter [Corynebacterium lowii]KQB87319.1 Urea transporter [Corynebacterium lowii]MDP9852093.1 urea transporter [Corynebacterium lowii]
MRAVLTSLAQIYLVPSWMTGLVIAVALALVSPVLAAGAVLGAAVGCGLGLLFLRCSACSARLAQVREGLWGYNGALIGALVTARCGLSLPGLGWLLLGVCCAVGLQWLLEGVVGRAGLPVLTAPFCAVGMVYALVLPPAGASEGAVGGVLGGVASAFAQVSLGSGWLPGLLILLGLALGSWRAAAWGLGGAAVSVVCLLAIPLAEFHTGVWSYCALLAAIAVGATFTPPQGRGGGNHRVIPATAAVALALLIQAAMTLAGWPVLTWPFVLATWVVLAVQGLRHGR